MRGYGAYLCQGTDSRRDGEPLLGLTLTDCFVQSVPVSLSTLCGLAPIPEHPLPWGVALPYVPTWRSLHVDLSVDYNFG